jgi:lon-related putative ATP-dependent protease
MARALPASTLRAACDPASLPFGSTAELQPLEGAIGQERAVEALRFALAMRRPGYNLFARGPPGIGKHDVVRAIVAERAAGEATPDDWCYVNGFEDSRRPRALRLPPGRAVRLRDDVDRLLAELKATIPTAFDSEDYRSRRRLIEDQNKRRHEKAFGEIEARARERSIAMVRTPVGLGLAPMRDGEVLDGDQLAKLSEDEQSRFKRDLAELQQELQSLLAELPKWEREHRERLGRLDHDVMVFAAGHLVDDLRRRYADLPEVAEHLQTMQEDIVRNADEFRPAEDGGGEAMLRRALARDVDSTRRYRVNVLVDNDGASGAPVVVCDHPTQANLVGTVEHVAQLGALVTDFTLIKPGALHRANGGYLLVDARKLLGQPNAWEELKRTLRAREVRIETLHQSLGLSSTVSLEPQPIPLDVKMVLLGDRLLFYYLAAYDTDLQDLFKVVADFDESTPRTDATEVQYARYVAGLVRQEGLRALDRGAVARLIEHGSRLASDGSRLSARVEEIGDVVREAEHVAATEGRNAVTAMDVQRAIDARIHRMDRVRERTLEEIGRGTILIDTEGERIGQINGLSVLQLGHFAFGRPSRITARVRMGTGGVVDIEREVSLGGPLHSKGVLILSGFLGERYSAERPLSLAASVVFEQSYGGVDGDSASAAELLALLSAIAEVPLRQDVAITGSVNQLGAIQPIGGVNEKIEGYFDVCAARGLSGRQGVAIPASNVKHLMLRDDVVEAVEAGRFAVYAVETADEAIELFTGLPAGARGEDGAFPDGSVNARVEARLTRLAEKARQFGRAPRGNGPADPQEKEEAGS